MTQKGSRAADEEQLAILDCYEHDGPAITKERFGITNSKLQGIRDRMRKRGPADACECTKPENQDGGMPRRWWAQ